MLAGAGAIWGCVLAVFLTRALAAAEAADLPRVGSIRFDLPVWLFAGGVALLIAVILTLVPLPASGSAGVTLRDGSRVAGRPGRASRKLLVAGELALAVALSAAGALLGLSLVRLFAVDPGFDARGVAVSRVSAYAARYPALTHVETFVGAILDDLRRLPGITHAAAGSSLPLSGQTTGTGVLVEGAPVPDGSRQGAGWQFVTPGYFAALGMPIRRGRDFTAEDRVHAGHVTIINDDIARALFGGADPIGRRIAMGDGDRTGDWHEIVGVVGGVRHHALDTAPAPRAYDLFGEHWGRTVYIVARSTLDDPAGALSSMRRSVALLDPEAPLFESSTMARLIERSAAPHRLAAALAGGLALCAVLLALVGTYAVAAASVAERTREIGIRAALGAAPAALVRMVMAEGLWTAVAGGATGIAVALAAGRVLAAQLFGVRTPDLLVVVPAVCGLVFCAAMFAVLPAARRAARADPLLVMRAE
jgi:predicted permease